MKIMMSIDDFLYRLIETLPRALDIREGGSGRWVASVREQDGDHFPLRIAADLSARVARVSPSPGRERATAAIRVREAAIIRVPAERTRALAVIVLLAKVHPRRRVNVARGGRRPHKLACDLDHIFDRHKEARMTRNSAERERVAI